MREGVGCDALGTPSLAPAETTQDHQGYHYSQHGRPPEAVHRIADAQRIHLSLANPHPATIAIERLEEWDARHAIGSDDDTVQPQYLPGSPDLYLLTGREWTRWHQLRPPPPSAASADGQQDKHSERGPENPKSRQREPREERRHTLATIRPLDVTQFAATTIDHDLCTPAVHAAQRALPGGSRWRTRAAKAWWSSRWSWSSGRRELVQPAIKCRGREYLRIIYGPEYTLAGNLERLRSRGLAAKRSLALRKPRKTATSVSSVFPW
jgi:hypothetical protein